MGRSIYDIIKKDKGTVDAPALADYMLIKEDVSNDVKFLSTNIIPLNLLFSGRVDGGIPIGKISMISTASMYGKSFLALGIIKNAQKKGMQCVYIDTEYAFDFKWAQSVGVDISTEKLVVLQENSIELIKNVILKICDGIPKTERKDVLFIIDSWGALVTSKTIEDGLTGNNVVDMTEAKKKNQLANILLNTRATYFVINHVYDNVSGRGELLNIPGGRKIMFVCSSVVLGKSRAKDKDKDKNVVGNIITAETFKSRFSKEKSSLQYQILHSGGINPFYGILDDALEGKYIVLVKPGYYSRPCVVDDKAWKESSLYCSEFWLPVFKMTDIKVYLESKYTFTNDLITVNEQKSIEDIERGQTETVVEGKTKKTKTV